MDKYLKFTGNEDEVARELSFKTGIKENDSYKIFYFILNNPNILLKDEFIKCDVKKINSFGMTFSSGKYYINVKITTIVVCAFILDISFTQGIVSTILSLTGIPTQAFVKLNGFNGERCILREVLKSKNKVCNATLLKNFLGKCVNNDIINCIYREEDNCTCSIEDVKGILNNFDKLNILKKDFNNNYHYCL